MMLTKFKDDDAAYLDWVERHRRGFVLNANREPKAAYLVLHRAECTHITKTRHPAGAWTERGYVKVCADEVVELERWAHDVTGGTLQHCLRCKPI